MDKYLRLIGIVNCMYFVVIYHGLQFYKCREESITKHTTISRWIRYEESPDEKNSRMTMVSVSPAKSHIAITLRSIKIFVTIPPSKTTIL